MMSKATDKRVEIIDCACGCGETLNKYDGNYRTREYVSGHNNRIYEDPKAHKKAWYNKHKEDRREISKGHKRKYYQEKRHKVLAHMGDKCVGCGLVHNGENTPIFDLHHLDSSTKEFSLSSNGLDSNSIEKVLLEAEKCVILCANCHRLHHHTDLMPLGD